MVDYPGQVPSFTVLVDDVDDVLAAHQNTPNREIEALATFLGALGSGRTQGWSTDVLAALCNGDPICTKASASTISVSAGVVWVKNSGQSIRVSRRNTSPVTVTAADLDTGAMAVGYYYIYAVADAIGTTFTVKFSASASAPTGLTNFELIGWFYNQSAGALDITLPYVGNVKANGRDVPNVVAIDETTSNLIDDTTYGADLTGALARFYSSGRPVFVGCSLESDAANWMDNGLAAILDIDGTDEAGSETFTTGGGASRHGCRMAFMKVGLAAGGHLYTVQAKVSASNDQVTRKHLIIAEF